MAGDRRLSPAELKARLQANLAVAGAKSSDPGPVQTLPVRPSVAAPPEAPEPIASESIAVEPIALEPKPDESNRGSASQAQSAEVLPESEQSQPLAAPLRNPSHTSRESTSDSAYGNPLAGQVPEAQTASQTPPPNRTETSLPNPTNQAPSASAQTPAQNLTPQAPSAPTQVKHDPVQASDQPTPTTANLATLSPVPEGFVGTAPAGTRSVQAHRELSGSSTAAKQTSPAPTLQSGSMVETPRALLGRGTGVSKTDAVDRETTATTSPAVSTAASTAIATAAASAGARKRAASQASTAPKRPTNKVLHRRDQGAVLRGYRIPVDLHRQAERAKLGLASRRGSSLFWDELLQGAIDLLLDDIHKIAEELRAARRSPEISAPTTRVLQAAIRHDQDLRLRMLRIDLEELDGATVRLEEIWTWLIRQVVKNEG
jgi:hypothetical protein